MEKNRNVKLLRHPEGETRRISSRSFRRFFAIRLALNGYAPLSPSARLAQNDVKKGFTLAEVLITLGIIGVVAALTIPTLVANYQARAWDTAATVFERELEEGLKVMNSQQVLAGYKTTEKFVEELQKHVKITKTCLNDKLLECFEDKVYWGTNEDEVDMLPIKSAGSFGQKTWGTNLVGLQFANGVSGIIAYNPNCKQDPYSNSINTFDCISLLYDTSGFSSPNTSGKDLRNISVKSLNDKCTIIVNGSCFSSPTKVKAMSFSDCTGGANATSGTATPAGGDAASLGIKECSYDSDFWAGAVQYCGGVNKLPTAQDLSNIANYVYNRTDITSDMHNLTLDTNKSSSLGFGSAGFSLWFNQEESATNAYKRSYLPTFTSYWHVTRNTATFYTICKGD